MKATMRMSAPRWGQTSGGDGNGPNTVGARRPRARKLSLWTSALRFSAAARQLGYSVHSWSVRVPQSTPKGLTPAGWPTRERLTQTRRTVWFYICADLKASARRR